MSRLCCVTSCSTLNPVPSKVTLYPFPKSKDLGEKWKKFITESGCRWKNRKWEYLLVCSKHFKATCFENLTMFQMGFASKLVLKPGAIPSITKPPMQVQSCKVSPSIDSNIPKPSLGMIVKRTVATQTKLQKEFGQTFKTGSEANMKKPSVVEGQNVIPINKLVVVPSRPKQSVYEKSIYSAEDVLRFHRTLLLPAFKEGDNDTRHKFKRFMRNFLYTENGDLYYKSLGTDFIFQKKVALLCTPRKNLVFDHFHKLRKEWNSNELSVVIGQYFYWPSFLVDYNKWKFDDFVKNACHKKHQKSNAESEVKSDFLKNFNLAPKRNNNTDLSSLKDHDYVADKLTVKRMFCPDDPLGEPPFKLAKFDDLGNGSVVSDRTRRLRVRHLSKAFGESSSSRLLNLPSKNVHSKKFLIMPKLERMIPFKSYARPEEFRLTPDPESSTFLYLLGMEAIVERLNDEKRSFAKGPLRCSKCGSDRTPKWRREKYSLVCVNCFRKEERKKRKEASARRAMVVSKKMKPLRPVQPQFRFPTATNISPVGSPRIFVKKMPRSQPPPTQPDFMRQIHHQVGQQASVGKMTLMEAANRIRDHINSRLVMLKKIAPSTNKKPLSAPVRIIRADKDVITHRTKPPSSEELIRCMRQSQRTQKKL